MTNGNKREQTKGSGDKKCKAMRILSPQIVHVQLSCCFELLLPVKPKERIKCIFVYKIASRGFISYDLGYNLTISK